MVFIFWFPVYCQQTLCTSALFEDLILFLKNKDSGVNLKRMSVYVILTLVSNNSKWFFFCYNTFYSHFLFMFSNLCDGKLEHLVSNAFVKLIYRLHVNKTEV